MVLFGIAKALWGRIDTHWLVAVEHVGIALEVLHLQLTDEYAGLLILTAYFYEQVMRAQVAMGVRVTQIMQLME